MEVNVKVTVDLGDKTMALINSLTADQATETPKTRTMPKPKPTPKPTENPDPNEAAEVEKPAPVKLAETKPNETPEPLKGAENKGGDWGKMDDDDKLDAIKSQVTKFAKKGKASDIKFMLGQFDAQRASELNPKDYDAFYAAIIRYGEGEDIEAIFPNELD